MHYNSFNSVMRARFGCKVYKLALDGGFTCPNRDGTLGTRGCIFCGEGSGAFAQKPCGDVLTQIDRAKERVQGKNGGGKYVAYFQSFTNTYAPAARLREMFTPVLSHPEVAALSIATRPDCLEPEKVALLAELGAVKPVWVELGLQTVNPVTAAYIRRGYDLPVYDDAVSRLKAAGLEVITHVILGLPGEAEADLYATVDHVSRVGSDGIKLQLLHVLRGTDLYDDYLAGRFSVRTLPTYSRLVEGWIRRRRPDMVIPRLTGDGAKRDLAAPLWSGDKKAVLNAISAALERDNVIQGELYTP